MSADRPLNPEAEKKRMSVPPIGVSALPRSAAVIMLAETTPKPASHSVTLTQLEEMEGAMSCYLVLDK